jgi:hypothetical protein
MAAVRNFEVICNKFNAGNRPNIIKKMENYAIGKWAFKTTARYFSNTSSLRIYSLKLVAEHDRQHTRVIHVYAQAYSANFVRYLHNLNHIYN